jgi:hypothetical protein
MPDATYVRIEPAETPGAILRCFFGSEEVGHFKWDEVAGYTVSATSGIEGHAVSVTPWLQRLETP